MNSQRIGTSGIGTLDIGILGGGQLARMLCLAASPLGIKTAILAEKANDPGAQVSSNVTVGPLSERKVLTHFLKSLSAVTFESEFVDSALLAGCLSRDTHVFPSLKVLEIIQDRLTQKQLLQHAKIPTSPWLEVRSEDDLKRAAKVFKNGFVLKQRRFGYDGYGTFVVKDPRKVDFSVLQKSNYGFIAEAFVPFRRELAISFVRSKTGEFVTLPLVESVQKDSRCFSVRGPVQHRQIKKLSLTFKKLMQQLDYQGILAVELFETAANRFIVNELAPRVHNSAHYSQNALTCDQFEYHLRAGLGLPLPKVQLLKPGFAMVNLLGEGHSEINLSFKTVGKLHWYGKTENRPGRKLGHLNVLANTSVNALKAALQWRKDFQL